ncbi:hypothetical protein SELMODRAFT_406308 [Selaginella moellendorffii]|uniref:BRCT domain-containing protein n=1 Tax=Selaginella moellendorffii TaxID=88036 RepID=D8R1Y5_SELML|nr:hypothetical protein SELMODRAFT_406308 [Selaginella moellendorffii]
MNNISGTFNSVHVCRPGFSQCDAATWTIPAYPPGTTKAIKKKGTSKRNRNEKGLRIMRWLNASNGSLLQPLLAFSQPPRDSPDTAAGKNVEPIQTCGEEVQCLLKRLEGKLQMQVHSQLDRPSSTNYELLCSCFYRVMSRIEELTMPVSNSLVISCKADAMQARNASRVRLQVFNTEWLIRSVMKQELDFEANHRFFVQGFLSSFSHFSLSVCSHQQDDCIK